MNIRITPSKKYAGFSVLVILLVIALLVVAIGGWSLSGQTNLNNVNTSNLAVQASTIINDGDNIKSTYDKLIITGNSVNSITFLPNTVGSSNILDSSVGIPAPKVNPNSIKPSVNAFWIYLKSVSISGNNKQMIILPGIKDGVCKQINYNYNGTNSVIDVGMPTASLTMVASSASPVDSTNYTFSSIPNGMTSGCAGTTGDPDNNYYFRIL